MGRLKKGIFFTIDALMAMLLLVTGLILMSKFVFYEQPTEQILFTSSDIMSALSTIRMNEIQLSWVQNLISTGVINNSNNTVLEQIGEFWVNGQTEYAQNITDMLINDLIPENYGVLISVDGQKIFLRNNSENSNMLSSKKMISGIQQGKPIYGNLARAWASRIKKNTSLIIPFQPQGSAWYGSNSTPGTVVVTKYFTLNDSSSIFYANMFLSLHTRNGSYELLNVNNGLCSYNRSSFSAQDTFLELRDIKNCLVNGTNIVKLSLRNPGFHGHIHPGTRIEIFYEKQQEIVQASALTDETFYFDDLESFEGDSPPQTGVWMIFPFYIDPSTTNRDVQFFVNIKDFDDTYAYDANNTFINSTDIRIYLNNETPIYADGESLCPDTTNATPMSWDVNCSYLHDNKSVQVEDKPFIYCSKETYMTEALSTFSNITMWLEINNNNTARTNCFNDLNNGTKFKVALLEDPHLKTAGGGACAPGSGSGSGSGMAADFEFDTSSIEAKNDQLKKGKAKNNGGSDIWIDKMIVDWWVNSGGEDLTEIKIKKDVGWSGSANSGTLVDINDYKLGSGKSEEVKLTFNFQAGAKDGYNVTFIFLDGSNYTQSNICYSGGGTATEKDIIEAWVARGGLLFMSEHIKMDIANITYGNRGKNLCDNGKDNNPGNIYGSSFSNGTTVDITDVTVNPGEKQAFEVQFSGGLNWNPITRVKLFYNDATTDDFRIHHENISKVLPVGNKSAFLLAEANGNKASFRVDSNDTSSYTITNILFEFENNSYSGSSIKSYDNCLESADFITIIENDNLTTLTLNMSFYPEEIPYVQDSTANNYKAIGEYEDGTDGLARWDYGNGTIMYLSDFNNLFTGSFPFEVKTILEQLLVQAFDKLDFEKTFNITPFIVDGMNVIGVYVNTYDNFVWGDGSTRIYSDPVNSPNSSTRISVKYTGGSALKYGLVDVSRSKEFGGNSSNSKELNFTYPPEAVLPYRTLIHISQLDSNKTNISVGNPLANVFSSKFSFAVPTTFYTPSLYFSLNDTNFVMVEDTSNISILPNSTVEYNFYVQTIVGYNDTFNTKTEAINDALRRLNQTLGSAVDSVSVSTQTNDFENVRSVWGPAIIDMRIWQ